MNREWFADAAQATVIKLSYCRSVKNEQEGPIEGISILLKF